MGLNSQQQFKKNSGATATAIMGSLTPDKILIVGGPRPQDPKLDDWNEDLWDEARLVWAIAHPIDPKTLIRTSEMGGTIEPVGVCFRRGLVFCVNGRRRTMGTDAANAILLAGGANVDALIELSIFEDKSTDLESSVRVGNSGRLDDPPWVSAANAARLLGRGKSEEQIAALLTADPGTVKRWLKYAANLDPAIKALIEDPTLTADARLPFMIGVELALNSGKGEHKAQNVALDYLRRTDARLKGERGRENAKTVIRAVMAGTLETAPPVTESDEAPASQPPAAGPGPDAVPGGPVPSPSPAPNHNAPGGRSSSAGGHAEPKVTTMAPKMSWSGIREVTAHLEASPGDPHKDDSDRLAYAIMMVVTGQDQDASGLAPWPRTQEKFRKVVRSGPSTIPGPKQPTPPPAVKPAAFQSPHLDAIRSIQCPVTTCDKGVDKRKKGTCPTCEGYGKISPARAEKLKLARKTG